MVATGEDAAAQGETVAEGGIEGVEAGVVGLAEGGEEGNEILLDDTRSAETPLVELRADARLHWKTHSLAGVRQDSTAHQECNLQHKWLGSNEKNVQL